MNYKILKDGEVVNTIVAGSDFVEDYCKANGYTYELIELEPEPDPKPTTEQRVTDLEEAMELLLSGATGETEVAEDEA